MQMWTVSQTSPSSYRIKWTHLALIVLNLAHVERPKMFHNYDQLYPVETNYNNKQINHR